MPRIMVVGSSNTDMVVKTERLPAPGETVIGGEFVSVPGGKGANQAVAAARLGAEVIFVARLGCDVFGDSSLRNFEREGLSTKYVVRDPEKPSGVALIFVDSGAENMIAVAPGSNGALSPADVDRAAEALPECDALVVQLEVPIETVEHAVRLAHGLGVRVILNPAPARPLSRELLSMADVLVPNETEARQLLGLSPDERVDDAALVRRFLDMGVKSVILTLGARGVLVVTADESRTVPARRVQAVDTTAAGDAFTGALAVALSSGMDMFDSARFACTAASIAVTRLGAQCSMPTRKEVDVLLG
jgi:ribokinase